MTKPEAGWLFPHLFNVDLDGLFPSSRRIIFWIVSRERRGDRQSDAQIRSQIQ